MPLFWEKYKQWGSYAPLDVSKEDLPFLALLATAFFLPIFPSITTLTILAFVIFWMVAAFTKQHYWLTKERWNLFFPMGLYALLLISIFYSDNLPKAYENMEKSTTLLLFPISFLYARTLKNDSLKKLLVFFGFGCLIILGMLLPIAFWSFFETGNRNSFFYTAFAKWHHPGYLSLYFSFGILIFYKARYWYGYRFRNLATTAVPSLFFGLILLASKVGFLFLAIIGAVILLDFIMKKKNLILVLLTVIMGSGFLITYTNPEILPPRLRWVLERIDAGEYQRVDSRFIIWETTMELTKTNFLTGVGVGDVIDALSVEFCRINYENGYDKKYNPHNQILHTTLAVGLSGLLVYVGMFLVPFFQKKQAFRSLFWGFLLLCLTFGMVESFLERQAGIIFFSLFYTCFASVSEHE